MVNQERYRVTVPMGERLQILWDDGERVFSRGPDQAEGSDRNFLYAHSATEHPLPASLARFAHEFGLKDALDATWAVRPLKLTRADGRTVLTLEDPGGEPLSRLVGSPIDTGDFLRTAVGIAAALAKLHQHGLVHKDLKPTHILVNCADGHVRLTGFGLTTRLPRERQAPQPPETIAGTLAYMAPEQTGRMNRSIDSRSDLYALGVTLYQMLTGALPFTATDAMEWVHCHIARTPVPPGLRANVPAVVSNIVMKLLAKTAEERYQTAAGVAHDLQRCLADWQRQHRIDDFPLDEHGTPDRLLIPEKLYGRERDVNRLCATFARVMQSSVPELVLVSGYSGIGKSSVVNELHKTLVASRGLFASGKFDQYKRDIPYATLVQAFRSLVRSLLGKPDAELAAWRDALREALAPNARLMTDLIPELKLIIGEPPPVPELEPQQAQRRFLLLFRRFIGVFARPEHPLALFLDDLQWLDAATLDLIESLLTDPDLRHVLLIGAYRDNEVDASHPLSRKLQAIRSAGGRIEDITLAPLGTADIQQMIAEALYRDPEHIAPLAQLVEEKTGGNPFFVIQFLQALVEEDLLTFDHDARAWRWQTDRIHAKGYTDNIVDLMVGKLARLPAQTQQALQQLACLGNAADLSDLSTVLGTDDTQTHAVLWEAIRQELLERQDDAYAFVHDRVHEAAYSLIPEDTRAEAHLRIGRLLAARIPAARHEEAIFDIVGQLNRGATLITEWPEREQLAAFNLVAGRRAKASTAYGSALAYVTTGAELLRDECWEHQHELMFALELDRAECEFLTGQLPRAEARLAALSRRAITTVERARVACWQMNLYLILARCDTAVAACLDFLRSVGIEWSPHPDGAMVRSEYDGIFARLGDRQIEDLIDLPPMKDADVLATVDALTTLLAPAVLTDSNLACLTICKAINLSLAHGHGDASCVAYTNFPRFAGRLFGDYQPGFAFGRLGRELVERRGLERYEANTRHSFSIFVAHWTQPLRGCLDQLRHVFDTANRIGDIPFGAFSCNCQVSNLLFIGEPLPEVQREAELGLAFARKVQFGIVVAFLESQLALIRMLRGATPAFGRLDNEPYSEAHAEQHLAQPSLEIAACWYWVRKLQARYLAGDLAAALDAASKVHGLLWTAHGFLEETEYHFYAALTHAALCDTAPANRRQQHLETLVAHHGELRIWEALCPENFASHTMLVGAEIARLDGRLIDAELLYEQAIDTARQNSFIHVEALANELAAGFFAQRHLEKIARVYRQDARYAYLRWGADGKVRQLEAAHPHLRTEAAALRPTSTMAAPVEHLDLATVIKVSQATSGAIVLDELIDMVMRTAIEQAGAERGLLILSGEDAHRIAAEATTGADGIALRIHDLPVSAATLPESVLYHVLRTHEHVALDDALTDPLFAADPYIRQHRVRSVLCLLLVSHAKLTGVLYLENNLAPRAFSPARIAVLRLVAAQAANSLENARLYRDIAAREAKILRLVESNIIGIVVWDVDGSVREANDVFLGMVGYDRDDLVSGRVRWQALTPPEFQHLNARAQAAARETGRAEPFEKEYIRKDGSRVPVIVGLATFDGNRTEGVAFVLDLTERKQAEENFRESERRYREVQTELAHANRVSTMGQLVASIAHEVNQPIAATLTNAQAATRWLGAQPPNVDEAVQALGRIVKDANRAGDVLGRIRGMIKKAPPRKAPVDINAAIREVVALTHGEASKSGASVEIALAEHLPSVEGDRVELQQVLLNLILNALEAMGTTTDGARTLQIITRVEEGAGVHVAVRDSGPGFGQEGARRVFDPFYTTKPTGLGMGLSICRSIIDAHGGRLWASPNEPRGAVVEFIVPGRQDDSPS